MSFRAPNTSAHWRFAVHGSYVVGLQEVVQVEVDEAAAALGQRLARTVGLDEGVDSVLIAGVADIDHHAETIRAYLIHEGHVVHKVLSVFVGELDRGAF